MVSTAPKVDPRGLYGIKETAALLGVALSTITRASNTTDPDRRIEWHIRKQSGRRVYLGSDIIDYWRRIY